MKHSVFAIVIILILFGSCARIHYLNIEIRKDAPVMFAPDIKRIIIVDNSFITSGTESVFEINNRSFITKDVVDSVRYTLLSSLAKYMNEERVFDAVEVYPYSPKPLYLYKEATDETELPLTKDEVMDICTQTESDALISLDFVKISFGLKDYYTFLTRVEATVRAYSYEGSPQGTPVKLEKLMSSYISLDDGANRLRPQIMENSQWIADMLIDSLIPKWQSQRRVYHTEFPSPSKAKINLMDREKWANANVLWQEAFHKEKKWKKKVKYASNAALAYEYTDDIDAALKWINIAYELLPPDDKSELAEQIIYYRTILVDRGKKKALQETKLKTEE